MALLTIFQALCSNLNNKDNTYVTFIRYICHFAKPVSSFNLTKPDIVLTPMSSICTKSCGCGTFTRSKTAKESERISPVSSRKRCPHRIVKNEPIFLVPTILTLLKLSFFTRPANPFPSFSGARPTSMPCRMVFLGAAVSLHSPPLCVILSFPMLSNSLSFSLSDHPVP